MVGVLGAIGSPGCAGPPWYMGSPRDGRPSIPSPSAAPAVIAVEAEAAREQAACRQASEIAARLRLRALREPGGAERERLAVLVERRAADWAALGRDHARRRDLRLLEGLRPAAADRAGGARDSPASPVLRDPGCAEHLDGCARSPADVIGAALAHTVVARGVAGLHDDDRDAAWERAAGVWEHAGRPSDACRARIRRAHRDRDPASPAWQRALACGAPFSTPGPSPLP